VTHALVFLKVGVFDFDFFLRGSHPKATVPPASTPVQPPISTIHCLSLNKLILECYPPSCISNAILAESFPRLRVRLLLLPIFSQTSNFRLSTSPLPKSFSCNTYVPPRKCCKQKACSMAKFFRCNTYKKQGGGVRRRSDAWKFRRDDVQAFGRSQSHCSRTP